MTAKGDNYKWRALATVAVGDFMGPLDASVVNIALPQIAGYFGTGLTTVEWVVMAYLLVNTSLLLIYGRLGDMVGHKPIYVGGFSLFTLGSLLCSVSLSIGQLIFFRVVQALGAGMMMAIGPAIIADVFPANERGKAMGINGMVVAVGLAVGPMLGGFLSHLLGWRSIFYINLPIGAAGILWALRVLRYPRQLKRQRFDLGGSSALLVGLLAILLALSRIAEGGRNSLYAAWLMAGGIAVLLVFIWWELKTEDPMMDLGLFKNRLFTAACVSALLNFMSQSIVIFLMPFYLENVRGLPLAQVGLLMSSFPLVFFVVAPISGTLSDRIGSRILSSTGMAVATVGIMLSSRLSVSGGYGLVVGSLLVVGAGIAMFQSPNSSALMGTLPRSRLGIGAGMLATMRNMGMVLGTALSGMVYTWRLPVHTGRLINEGLGGATISALAAANSMRDAYLVGASLAALGIFTSLARGRSRAEEAAP